MTEDQKPKCDIDDIMCQMQVLNHLEGMERLFGTERFRESYPEFKDFGDVVRERMGQQRITIKEMMEKCGMPTEEFEKEEGMTKTETTTAEEE